MGEIVLLGCEESKRTQYFLTAASRLGTNIEFCDIRKVNKKILSNKLVKIDPTIYNSCEIDDLNYHVASYINLIMGLRNISGIRFLNTPDSIVNVLSKENCKRILMENNINTTGLLDCNVSSYEELKHKMRSAKTCNVFIKPNYGAGAAGVVAYRFNPEINREVIYTSANISEDKLFNTKHVSKYEDIGIIRKIINTVLSGSSLVERWTPKANHLDFTYDLRVVVQFGKVDFMVGRLSKNPITNLHLNNNAVAVHELGLTEDKIHEIETLCIRAVNVFDGMNVAGVDVLLTKHDLTPMIIEINAQGDLIYQDIYNRNIIYTNQILEMEKEKETSRF